MNQPNLLFLFSDQQRHDTLGCYGQALPVTPNLDRLAAEGVRFAHAFSPQPVCGPARACLQTGSYATESGCFVNGIALPEDADTLPKRLRAAGYEVAYVGKWHLGSNGDEYRYAPVPRARRGGYEDHWVGVQLPEYVSNSYSGLVWDADDRPLPFSKYRADAYTDHALAYLDRWDGQRPFFLFHSWVEPHPQPYHKLYKGPDGGDLSDLARQYLRYESPAALRRIFEGHDVPGDLAGTEGDWQAFLADYLAACAAVDANVGRLLAKLERLGILDNTLVLYTSDHGCHFHTRNRSDGKCSCHDNSIRVPLLVRGPGFRGGATEEALVSLLDLPPTVLRAGGAEPLAQGRGRPLQALTVDRVEDWADAVFVQISSIEVGRAVRTARWKYAVTAPGADPMRDAGSDTYVESHLYDLAADPDERHNQVAAPEFAAVRTELRRRLTDWMASIGEGTPAVTPAPEGAGHGTL